MSSFTQRGEASTTGKRVIIEDSDDGQYHDSEPGNASTEKTPRQKDKERRQLRSTIFLPQNILNIHDPDDRARIPQHITKETLNIDYQEIIAEGDGSNEASFMAMKWQRNELLARHIGECSNIETLKALVDRQELVIHRLTKEVAQLKEQRDDSNSGLPPRERTREPSREEDRNLVPESGRDPSRTARQNTLPAPSMEGKKRNGPPRSLTRHY